MILKQVVIYIKLVIPLLLGVLRHGLKVETIAELIGDNVEQVQKTYAHILPKFEKNELSRLHNYYKENKVIF